MPSPTTHTPSPNPAKMDSPCSPYSSLPGLRDFSCTGTTGPYGQNITSPKYTAANQNGQATMDALKACCKSPVTQVHPELYGICYSNCKTKGLEQALEVDWCLGNYTQKRPDYLFASLGCETTVSSATMLRRTSSWGGLVILSLVVSAAATMM